MSGWEALRWVNLAAVLAFVALAVYRRPFYAQQDPPVRLLLTALGAAITAAGVSTLHALADFPARPSVGPLLTLPILAWSLTALALARPRPTRRPPQ